MIPKDLSSDIEVIQEILKDAEDLLSDILPTVFCELHESVTLGELQKSDLYKQWKARHEIIRGRLLARGWKPYEWEQPKGGAA